jgi:hypothetical protein
MPFRTRSNVSLGDLRDSWLHTFLRSLRDIVGFFVYDVGVSGLNPTAPTGLNYEKVVE